MKFVFNPITGKLDWIGITPIDVLADAPTSPEAGQLYIDTDDDKLYIFYSGIWQAIATLTPPVPVTGNPIGLLLGLTYA